MIGDPSGKSAERNLLDDDALQHNLAGIVPLLRRFLEFEERAPTGPSCSTTGPGRSVLSLLDFLRDVGKHVTVNHMVAKESVRNRMDGDDGISFTEFSYMLLQANDFLWLFENEGLRDADRRLRPVGQHLARGRPDPPADRVRRPMP